MFTRDSAILLEQGALADTGRAMDDEEQSRRHGVEEVQPERLDLAAAPYKALPAAAFEKITPRRSPLIHSSASIPH